jgi:outer membrane protein insertion porin family
MMIRFAIYLACGLLLVFPHACFATEDLFDTSKPIVEIEWRGQANMGQDEFLGLIGIQIGDTPQRGTVRRSLERLYRKGFFSQIRIEITPIREGLKLTYYTTPAAFVQRYEIRGNRALSKKIILERLRPQVEEPFSEHCLRVSLEAFRQYYAEQGFPSAQITWHAEKTTDQTRVTISLEIDEGPPLLITEVNLEGVTAFPVDALLARFHVRVGQPLNTEQLSGDLEQLQAQYQGAGYLTMRFEEPSIQRDLQQHTAVVSITVIEGPNVKLEFAGNRQLSRQVLEPAVLIDALGGYTEDTLLESDREMLQRYHEQGFHFATITHQVEDAPEGRKVLITFRVQEGPRVTVKDLHIIGNAIIPAAEIRAQFLTRPREFFGALSKGLFIEQQLDKDLEAVQFLDHRRGFLQAAVGRALLFNEDGSKVIIQVNIAEGERTYVRSLTMTGSQAAIEAELRSQLSLHVGDAFDEVQAQEDIERLQAVYQRRGYRDVRLTLDKHFEDDGRFVHLTYHIGEGSPTRVGNILIQGNFRTQTEIITRELTFRSGDPLSLSKLIESRRKLSQLSLFSRIAMDPQLEEITGEEDVVVALTERKPKAFNFGLGYGSEDKLRGFVEYTHNNIAGMHRQFRVRAQASFLEQRYLMNFREPRLFGTLTSATTGLSQGEEEHVSFDVRRTSAQMGFERVLWEQVRGFLTYSFDIERLSDVDSEAELGEFDHGTHNIASFLGILQRDTRDKIIEPHRGSLQRLSFEVADLLLGSEANYFKIIGASQWFFPLPWETVGAISAQGGIADAFGTTGEVPISRRFFLGGSTTLRGYDYERVGPTGPDGTPTGGDLFVLANLEWRVPVYRGFGVVLFSDVGNVFRAVNDFQSGQIKGSVGLGVRYHTPIGPIRLDYGYKLDPQGNEASGRFHFSIGQAF